MFNSVASGNGNGNGLVIGGIHYPQWAMVPQIVGRIVKIGQMTPKGLQNVWICTESNEEIKLVVCDRAAIGQELLGAMLGFQCVKDKSGQLSGIKVKPFSYTNKSGRLIEGCAVDVKNSANMEVETGMPVATPTMPAPAVLVKQAAPVALSAMKAPMAPLAKNPNVQNIGYENVNDIIFKAGLLMEKCCEQVMRFSGKLGLEAEMARGLPSTMFIQLANMGVILKIPKIEKLESQQPDSSGSSDDLNEGRSESGELLY